MWRGTVRPASCNPARWSDKCLLRSVGLSTFRPEANHVTAEWSLSSESGQAQSRAVYAKQLGARAPVRLSTSGVSLHRASSQPVSGQPLLNLLQLCPRARQPYSRLMAACRLWMCVQNRALPSPWRPSASQHEQTLAYDRHTPAACRGGAVMSVRPYCLLVTRYHFCRASFLNLDVCPCQKCKALHGWEAALCTCE